uniref:Uncharacterized protein n=1 Tax=Chromera velia CCMP2878 TaxID=1169474 RepID=A0A0G4HI70_9ALVE|mmetsp:Transcript_20349/g.40738  ORF Transcript_20349/g.40738 Transcript_20349/m.40738 type:complete len:309 (-) Transcript_20349:68-994(-)|eukprot:Cvel_6923.t1-p1 / transcript=Cvel_6923.t1 / gene=Cvel_6923 / organism=Chromera_velia_CCMP2878 / gene_product=hypothetical protein / transcript_product=hypothetical protein / location=Cvel_scaffold350:51508-55205(+) / protein_length=308 / sequence_SO=supercontig / SO=protein_coding / is_pseudo=false
MVKTLSDVSVGLVVLCSLLLNAVFIEGASETARAFVSPSFLFSLKKPVPRFLSSDTRAEKGALETKKPSLGVTGYPVTVLCAEDEETAVTEDLLKAADEAEASGDKLEACRLITQHIRRVTEGGVPTPDLSPSPEAFLSVWRDNGPRAAQLARECLEEDGKEKDPERLALLVEAGTYAVSGKGLARAALGGGLSELQKANKVLREVAPSFDNGVGHIFAGNFYVTTPWPLRSFKKGRERFDLALKVAPSSGRNLYFAGLGALLDGSPAEAAKLFQAVLGEDATFQTPSEIDLKECFQREAGKGLKRAS